MNRPFPGLASVVAAVAITLSAPAAAKNIKLPGDAGDLGADCTTDTSQAPTLIDCQKTVTIKGTDRVTIEEPVDWDIAGSLTVKGGASINEGGDVADIDLATSNGGSIEVKDGATVVARMASDTSFISRGTTKGPLEAKTDVTIETGSRHEGTIDVIGTPDNPQVLIKDDAEVKDDVTAVGNIQVDTGVTVEGNLETTSEDETIGKIDIGKDSTIEGNIFARTANVPILKAGVVIEGDVISACKTVKLEKDLTIKGCALGEQVDVGDATVEGGVVEQCDSVIGDEDTSLEDLLGGSKDKGVSALAGQTTRVSGERTVYQGGFNADNWSGVLRAIPIDQESLAADEDNVQWLAENGIPDVASERDIFTQDSGSATRFQWSAITSDQQSQLSDGGGNGGEELLKYLRGNRSSEGSSSGDRRERNGVLGPIINSTPALSGNQNFGFEVLPENDANDYEDWLENRSENVYVGANDGMLHAFDATSGEELFAFVPDGAYSDFRDYASQGGFRQYFVDATPKVAHAHFNDADGWQSILLTSMGAGGESVFALNVTDVSATDSFNEIDVLWEFEHDDLGHTISQPTFARLNGERWVAMFGNGYGPDTGKLFIVDLETGQLIPNDGPIETGLSSDEQAGLIGVRAFDSDGDRVTETVYAGDLQGNLWKFDVSSDKPKDWGLATSGSATPLFSAGFTDDDGNEQTQPITTRPTVGPGPGSGSFLVYFGTGERGRTVADAEPITRVSDANDTQSFYAVVDNGSDDGIARGDLVEQEILEQFTNEDGERFRVLSDNTVDLTGDKPDLGWHIDLADEAAGEIVTSPAQLERGLERPRAIFTTASISSSVCAKGGDGWLMEADALTGAQLERALFDVNGDGSIDSDDVRENEDGEPVGHATGRGVDAAVGAPLILSDGSATETLLMGDGDGGIQEVKQSTKPDQREGWIELE